MTGGGNVAQAQGSASSDGTTIRRGVVDDSVVDDLTDEQRNLRNLIRVVGGFVAWPSLSISVAFMLDLEEHFLHIAGLFPLGVAGLVAMIMAPKLAKKWAPEP
jgi:hypothetical protein